MLGEVGPLHKLMKWIEGLRDDENISIFITVLDLFLTLYSSAVRALLYYTKQTSELWVSCGPHG